MVQLDKPNCIYGQENTEINHHGFPENGIDVRQTPHRRRCLESAFNNAQELTKNNVKLRVKIDFMCVHLLELLEYFGFGNYRFPAGFSVDLRVRK